MEDAMLSYAIQLAILFLFIAAAGIVGEWRHEAERLDQSVDDVEETFDPTTLGHETKREPPSV
jgi:hypothetical protein